MSVYAIGDVQGCYDPLMALLDKLKFDPNQDQLWFTGDIVNRGPDSLKTIRFIKNLPHCVCVLGNHDLHLLALAYGDAEAHKKDTLQAILEAPDRDELLTWLRHRPLLHHDPVLNFTMVHAGVPPQWNLTQAKIHAREVEFTLQGTNYQSYFCHMYGNKPKLWNDTLSGYDRLRYITNAFTRMRYCNQEGKLKLKYKGTPGTQPKGLIPWYLHPNRLTFGNRIVCGHWATLSVMSAYNVYALDSGCIWGGALTALKLGEDPQHFETSCK